MCQVVMGRHIGRDLKRPHSPTATGQCHATGAGLNIVENNALLRRDKAIVAVEGVTMISVLKRTEAVL